MNAQEMFLNNPGIEVCCEGVWTSKQEFKDRSDAIAVYLSEHGISVGDAVLLNMERSAAQLIALAGIFKSGAAAVPVSPNMPENRVEKIRRSCRPGFEITKENYPELSGETENTDTGHIRRAAEDAPALILYTSGSTGIPKGVCHTQDSLLYALNTYPAHLDRSGIRTEDVIGLTELNYISGYLFEIGPAFLMGKRLFFLSEAEKDSVAAAAGLMESAAAPTAYMTPSKYRAYRKDERMNRAMNRLSVLCFAGEHLDGELTAQALEERNRNTVVYDFYGSTECGLIFWKDVRTKAYHDRKDVLIATDDGREAVPGEMGEICADAEHRFSGYMDGLEKRTVKIGQKEYFCTGDLGIRQETGSVTVTGRMDRLIKMHGLRIELGEIEHAIRNADGVTDAAVVYDAEAEKLVGFYVSSKEVKERELRSELGAELPYYMIPHVFVPLDRIPLGERGKVDYAMLKKKAAEELSGKHPGQTKKAADGRAVSEQERILSECAEEVLEIKGVRPGDSLLALGMDSLLGLQLVGVLEKKGYRMKLSDMFLHPEVAELSNLLEKADRQEESGEVVRITRFPVTDPFERYVVMTQFGGKQRQAMWVTDSFLVRKLFSEEEWQRRCMEIRRRHPALRSRFSMDPKAGVTQSIEEEPVGQTAYYDLTLEGGKGELISKAQEDRIGAYEAKMLEDTPAGMPPENAVFTYFRLGPESAVIYLRISHVLADGMSMSVLKKELTADTVEDGEDAFFPAFAWKNREENRAEAAAWFKEYIRGSSAAVFRVSKTAASMPAGGGPGFLSMNPMAIHTRRIDFGPAENRGILTPSMYVLYRYGKAAQEVLDTEAVVFYMTSSGRNIPVAGMNETVSGYANRIPVVFRKGEDEERFLDGIYQAESHFCLQVDEIWAQMQGEIPDTDKINLPVFVSEVFPDLSRGRVIRDLHEREYDVFGINCYFMILEGRMILQISYNSDLLDQEFFERFLEKLQA